MRVSFDEPEHTGDTTGIGAMRLLEAVRVAGVECRYYQASSSEMFGATPPPQNENTPFYPRSPYGAAKVYAYWVTKNYREAYGLFAVNGILFNHESPRRGETFVTRKVTRAVARIKAGLEEHVYMGNLDAVRDWGYAPEYVEGMWRMLQADEPDDYVLATGGNFTVRDFVVTAFEHAGLDWEKHVRFDERYLRPTEVDALIGDAGKAHEKLGWKATVDTDQLARIMVDADIEALEHEGRPGSTRSRWPAGRPGAGVSEHGRASVPDRSSATRRSTSPATAAWSASAIWRLLEAEGFDDLVGVSSAELDLRDRGGGLRRSSQRRARATSSSPRPRSAGSSPTAPTPWTSSPRTCRSRST